MIAAIEKRQKDIIDGLAASECAKNSLEISKIEAEKHLKQARETAQKIIERTNKRKAQIIDEAKTIAHEERNKILSQTQADIDAEYRRVRVELRKQLAMLVITGVEKIIERSIDEVSDAKIIDKIISDL